MSKKNTGVFPCPDCHVWCLVYIIKRFSVFVWTEQSSKGAVQTDSLPLPSIVTHSHILRPH